MDFPGAVAVVGITDGCVLTDNQECMAPTDLCMPVKSRSDSSRAANFLKYVQNLAQLARVVFNSIQVASRAYCMQLILICQCCSQHAG